MLKKRLKELRIEKGKTQEQLAKDLGTTDVSISRYEAGAREPKSDILNALADYFGVSTDYLLGRTNERNYEYKNLKDIKSISAHRAGEIEQLNEEGLKELDNYIKLLKLKYKK